MTNGIVVVIENGRVIAKVIVGCDGHRDAERRLARAIWRDNLRGAEDINGYAETIGFGCVDCRVVMTTEGSVWPYDEEDVTGPYKETFNQIGINPRFATGDLRWNPTVLDLDRSIIYEHDERFCGKNYVETLVK